MNWIRDIIMAVTQEACPNCGAPVQILPGTIRMKCPYCMMTLAVARENGEIALEVAGQITGSLERTSAQTRATIQEGTYVTQTELRRLQIAQDLSMAQMRLSNVQSEIRAVERSPQTAVTRNQLRDLRSQEAAMLQHIAALQAVLYPSSAPADRPASPRSASAKLVVPGFGLRRQLFSFEGRASRSTYWLGFVVCFVLSAFIEAAIGDGAPNGFGAFFGMVATVLFLWIGLAISIKRYHDLGKAGWWVLVAFIPVIGIFWMILELGFFPGTPGANRYG